MAEELIDKFVGDFPDDLIQNVGNEFDAEEGLWGLETAYGN